MKPFRHLRHLQNFTVVCFLVNIVGGVLQHQPWVVLGNGLVLLGMWKLERLLHPERPDLFDSLFKKWED